VLLTIRTLLACAVLGVGLVVTSLVSLPTYAESSAIPRIGALVPAMAKSPYEDGLRRGLLDLGYVEGQNLVIDWRRSLGSDEELRSLAADLAHSKVELIVTVGTPAARAAVAASTTPVVFFAGDPVGTGLAASVSRPGGTATGVSVLTTELTAKRLEFLRQLLPRARRIVLLMNSASPNQVRTLDAAREAAATLGVQLVTLDARNEAELDKALPGLSSNAADGALVSADVLFHANAAKVTRALRNAKLPAMFPFREYHEDGALMSYGPSQREVARSMAAFVDKILRGAKPADLPIEQISKYELVINLRVAKQIGVTVPHDLLLRADEVIR
jgi:putative ABC transport system substrate-binding protein